MAKTIYELFNAVAIAAYWQALYSNTIPYLGETLFPSKRMSGLKLDWIKGYDRLPVMLAPSAFDTQPTLRDRGGVDTVTMKMPFFREAMRIGEEDRQQLLTLLQAGGSYAQAIIDRLFDDASNLIDGATVNPEVMRMSLIQNGTISIASTNADSGQVVNYTYNYDPNGTWTANNTVEPATKWDSDGAKIISDILAIKRQASARGVILSRAIVGTEVWAVLLTDPVIAKDIYPLAADSSISDDELKQYLQKKTGITFTVYEKMYKNLAGTDTAFMDRGKVVFLPSGVVGATYFGTTPEEADLMAGAVDCDIRIVGGGIAVGTKKESLPVNVLTWASEIVLPSFESMNAVYVIKNALTPAM